MIFFWGECKDKACRVVGFPTIEQLQAGAEIYDPHCVGPKCPVWRWSEEKRIYGYCGAGGVPIAKVKEPVKENNKTSVRPYDGK